MTPPCSVLKTFTTANLTMLYSVLLLAPALAICLNFFLVYKVGLLKDDIKKLKGDIFRQLNPPYSEQFNDGVFTGPSKVRKVCKWLCCLTFTSLSRALSMVLYHNESQFVLTTLFSFRNRGQLHQSCGTCKLRVH